MTDHLNQAREIAECAQNWGSQDARSIPYALHGITHALIAITEALNAAGTPRTAPRSDDDAADVLADPPDSARPTEARTASERWQIPARQLDGSNIGKPVKIGMRIGTLRYVQHDGITTRLLLDCGPSGDVDWTIDSSGLVEVQW